MKLRRSAVAACLAVALASCHLEPAVGADGARLFWPLAAAQDHDVPTYRMSALGSDVSALPARYPSGDWIPIEAPLLSMEIVVRAHVDASATLDDAAAARPQPVLATLDTGAMRTTLSAAHAHQLGLVPLPAHDGPQALDAHGETLNTARVIIPELRVGQRSWRQVNAVVAGDDPELFLVGADLLQEVDLLVAADEGLVGIFAAGGAPTEPADLVVPLERSERQLLVQARTRAHGGGREVVFPLVIDTGASNSSVPLLIGINGGLTADLRFEDVTRAVGGERTQRGRFVLDPLVLGSGARSATVGRVFALGSNIREAQHQDGLGLLGNDVLMRQHTVISFARSELRLRPVTPRPPFRTRGPGDAACDGADGRAAPCVSVALVHDEAAPHDPADLPGVCMRVDVNPRYAGHTLELAITAAQPSIMNGGAIRAFLTANAAGSTGCFRLWRQLEHLGIGASTPLSLRWVRTEGVRWPCDPWKTHCITFTGPLARAPVR